MAQENCLLLATKHLWFMLSAITNLRKGRKCHNRQRTIREQKVWEIAEVTPNVFIMTHEFTLSVIPVFPDNCLAEGGAKQLVGRFDHYGIKHRKGAWGATLYHSKVKSHPFPPCSFLRGTAEHAVCSLSCSMQMRGHGWVKTQTKLLARARKYSSTKF